MVYVVLRNICKQFHPNFYIVHKCILNVIQPNSNYYLFKTLYVIYLVIERLIICKNVRLNVLTMFKFLCSIVLLFEQSIDMAL